VSEPLLNPALLRKLEQFQLLAARRAKSAAKGERRSSARGQSVEFADYRNYTVGDDFRYLDWNLYGRLERLYLKVFEEERELPVRIFLDASESMGFGEPPKLHFALQMAAAVGYVALCGFDRVAIQVFPANPENQEAQFGLRLVRGKKSTNAFFHSLARIRAGGATDLNEALGRGAMEARRTGLAVVLSDFLDPQGYEKGLNALVGRGFTVSAIQILSREEVAPCVYGDLRLIDSENGSEREVTFGKYRLAAYQKTVARFQQKIREFCQGRGIHFFTTVSDQSLDGLLLKDFRRARIWA
jgi:uncharacterized protein (DUF58 family)